MRLTSRDAWKALEKHAKTPRLLSALDLEQAQAAHDINPFKRDVCGLTLDYSKQRITTDTLSLLFDLAKTCCLKDKIDALMRGDVVNTSENRPALHTALRAPDTDSLWVNGRDVIRDVVSTRHAIKNIAIAVREGRWLGHSNKPITDVVNIGMGGSDLGAKFCVHALKSYVKQTLGFHFLSDADSGAFQEVVAPLNPETTLFIVSSKSFLTEETLYNAKKANAWINQGVYPEEHFIAVTAVPEQARRVGMKNILLIWDWVGGRYSSCSAMNLITAIAVGYDVFQDFLAGAHAMDIHFRDTPFERNLPVLSALLGIWNNNFLSVHTLLMLTYEQGLEYLVQYVQQLDMESNGKSVDKERRFVEYATGPIIWGGVGNRAQHSYYQLLCQGTHKIAAEFISVKKSHNYLINRFCEAKQHVLSKGLGVKQDMDGYIRGGVAISHIQLEQGSPYELGALVSFYEHKVYTQSVIWNINAFDQPGVEYAKRCVTSS